MFLECVFVRVGHLTMRDCGLVLGKGAEAPLPVELTVGFSTPVLRPALWHRRIGRSRRSEEES